MKILVCISVVPDTTSKISFKDNDTKFVSDGVQFIINPYDEMALSKSLEITESLGGTITVINVGLADTEANIRKALAIGANDAVRINAEPKDAMFVATQISNVVKNENYDLIFTGRESIDHNGGLVCGLLAEMLNIPSVNVVSKIEIEGSKIKATRDIDGGREELECTMPCVISAQKDLSEARIPNMRGIMAARTKPLKVVDAVSENDFSEFVNFELPPAKTGVKLIDAENAGELIDLLRNEKKLI
ncbi:MAG: electron transfer flavoprotein subunit beta/FixA family protein [Bacteroidetes bacterium]|nr:electron transfer flavoprotein subunit beta/FixA family protein [Bacteroidota bacterium]